ncbi:MAG: transglycosylase SLT domain-containing protein, partial [Bacteroidales bacterium]|nr:transglycosylase SLT domain-containing protein [Bacteroidales bacterium]
MKKRLRFLTLALPLLAGSPLLAQEHEMTADEKLESAAYRAMVEAQDSSLFILESLEDNDESDYAWTERQFIHIDPNCVRILDPEPVPDSVYIMRLRALPTIIEMPFNQPVKKALDFYLMRRRALVERMVSVGFNYYFPIFENALQKYELPSELKYLACIESALRQNAYSPARAAGLWQFIPATGIMQGLEVNSYIDERYDLYKSTEAACKFLKKLYNKFDDWHLAIAAYNCGPGNIDKAIARSGGHRTFWEIYNYLPQETRAYVPFFIAATYVMTYHCEHGLCGSVTDIPVECDTVMVNRMVHFEQIAHCLNLPMEVVESLNPQYIRDIVPGSPEKPHSITLPANKSISFLERQDSIFAYKAETLLPRNGRITEVSTRGRRNEYVRQGGNHGSSGSTASSSRIYTVRKGESLGSIARKHHTTSAKIKKLNKLRSDRIHP